MLRSPRARRATACAVLVAFPALAGVACGDGATEPAPLRDQIVFLSSRGAPDPLVFFRGIYAMRASDGGGVRRLAAGYDSVTFAAVSPDGRQLAFTDGLGGDVTGAHVYVGAATGRQFRRLTTVDQLEEAPSWSPDGRRVAFGCWARYSDAGALCVANADGTGYRVVYQGNPSRIVATEWLPDGNRIAFEEDTGGFGTRVMVVGADGSGLAPLPGVAGYGLPSWSRDGRRVAFMASSDSGSAVYVANADFTGVTRIGAFGARDALPQLSPDGTNVVFSSLDENTSFDVWVMRADGTGRRNLTSSRGVFDSYPVWATDR